MSARTPAPGRPLERAAVDDPPPYAWLDDPARMAGAVGIGTTVALGSLLGGVGLLAVGYGVFGGHHARGARLVAGMVFVVIGAVIVQMGMARRAWRRRHPGVDPLTAAVEAGANVGSTFGNDSKLARFGRWLLVAVCGFMTLIMVMALYRALTGQTPASTGEVLVVVLLGLFSAAIGVMAVVSRRPPRR